MYAISIIFFVGFPISGKYYHFIDRRYFYPSRGAVVKNSVKWNVLYPELKDSIRYYLCEYAPGLVNVLLKPLEEVENTQLTGSEKGAILQRAVYMILCWRRFMLLDGSFIEMRSGFGAASRCTMSQSIFNFKSGAYDVIEYSGIFPEINNFGIYWSSESNYPLVEGYIYNEDMLLGLQTTISEPGKHSSAKLGLPSNSPGVKTQEVLEEILSFCEQKNVGFSILYILPDEVYSKECTNNSGRRFNVLKASSLLIKS